MAVIRNLHLSDFSTALLDLVMPRGCVVCGEPLALRERHICIGCLADLPRTRFSKMRHNQMSDKFNALIQRDLQERNDEAYIPFSYATSLFFYRSGTSYRNITRRLKYSSDVAVGRYFAAMLSKEMSASTLYSDIDAVIPVPLHWTRLWERGYNQAEVIARELASGLGTSLRTDVLRRCRRTRTQTRLSVERKALNVAGAFRVKNIGGIEGCGHILLVDDVFTTGATLHSCYLALREVCPPGVRISVATLACVGL